jgi:hypothetical protein
VLLRSELVTAAVDQARRFLTGQALIEQGM